MEQILFPNSKSTNFGVRRRLSRVCSTHLQPGSRTALNGLDFQLRTKIIQKTIPQFINTVTTTVLKIQINGTHFKIITFHHSKIGKNQNGLGKYHFHFIYISFYLSMTNIIHFRNFYHITIFLSASNGNI